MKAMIFAAGLGTRLKPITNTLPKALVKVGGITLLERAILKLKKAGVNELIINIHAHAGQMQNFIGSLQMDGMKFHISDERDQLLDTGGGLKKAGWFLNGAGSFFLLNVDIVTNLDLTALFNAHLNSGALATLAVKKRESSRYLLFNKEGRLCGWENRKTGEQKIAGECGSESIALAFSGIHVIDSGIFDLIKLDGVFSMIDLYLNLAGKEKIMAFRDDESEVMDLGKVEELEKLSGSGFLGFED